MNKQHIIYRDGIEEVSSTAVQVSKTGDGHTVEQYTVKGRPRFFVTLRDSHYCAHGDTIPEAVADALWKDPEKRPDREELKKRIQEEGKDYLLSLNEFRLLTGACKAGCREALRQAGLTGKPMTAYDVRDKVNKPWGDKLLAILEWD